MLPITGRIASCKGSALYAAIPFFKLPVPAQEFVSADVIGGGNIATNNLRQGSQKGFPFARAGNVTPVKKDIAVFIQGITPGGERIPVFLQAGAIQPGTAHIDLTIAAIGDKVNGIEVLVRLQDLGYLEYTVNFLIKNHHLKDRVTVSWLQQLIHKVLLIRDISVDNDEFGGCCCFARLFCCCRNLGPICLLRDNEYPVYLAAPITRCRHLILGRGCRVCCSGFGLDCFCGTSWFLF